MQKIMRKSRVWLIALVFLLVLTPMASVVAAATEKEEVNYISLGDSLAAGQLFDRSFGVGYTGNIVEDLEAKGYQVNLLNKGVSGATSAEVMSQLNAEELATADVVTISAGANDLLRELDMSKIALFDASYLDDASVTAMKKAVKDEVEADMTASLDAAGKLTDEAIGEFATLDATMQALEEAVKPYEIFLPNNLKVALASMRSDLDKVELTLTQMTFEMGGENLHTISEELASVSENLVKINNTITMITQEIDKLPIDVPAEIVAALGTMNSLSESIKENINKAKIMIDDGLIKLAELDERLAAIDRLVANANEVQVMLANLLNKIEGVGKNTAEMVATIKGINPEARVYVLGYYNALPYLPAEIQQITVQLLTALNEANAAAATAMGAEFVPTFDAFAGKYETYLPNPEDIHPNEAGYRVIADAFMGKINASFPEVSKPDPEPEEPKDPSEPEGEPGESEQEPKKVEIMLDNDPVEVFAGALVTIQGTQTTIQLPEDLPSGTMLQILPIQEDVQKGLIQAGEAFDFIFTYPDGFEDYQGEFDLTMGVTIENEEVAIYHYQTDHQAWEFIGGHLKDQKLTVTVSNFSMYGVFALEDTTEEKPALGESQTKDDQVLVVEKVEEKNNKDGTVEVVKAEGKSQKLPITATNLYHWLLIGFLLTLVGASMELIRRKNIMN